MDRFQKFTPLFLALACAGIFSSAYARHPTTIVLKDDSYVVPKGHVWKVSGLTPYESEKGIGTADIYIDGQVQIGSDRESTIYGKFDFTLGDKQRIPIYILEQSKVSVGDSRGTLVVQDYEDK